jgi:hypothetical protein
MLCDLTEILLIVALSTINQSTNWMTDRKQTKAKPIIEWKPPSPAPHILTHKSSFRTSWIFTIKSNFCALKKYNDIVYFIRLYLAIWFRVKLLFFLCMSVYEVQGICSEAAFVLFFIVWIITRLIIYPYM